MRVAQVRAQPAHPNCATNPRPPCLTENPQLFLGIAAVGAKKEDGLGRRVQGLVNSLTTDEKYSLMNGAGYDSWFLSDGYYIGCVWVRDYAFFDVVRFWREKGF